MNHFISTLLLSVLLTLGLSACKKEKNWSTSIDSVDLDSTTVVVKATYTFNRNSNYLYVGVCWSDTPNPTVKSPINEMQKKNSGSSTFKIENLEYETLYYVRSFIKPTKGDVIYSDQSEFKTEGTPTAPCETDPGKVTYNGSNYTMDDLYTSTADEYRLNTSSAFGELTFIFNTKPTKNKRYTTESSFVDLNSSNVRVSGILGEGGFTCAHGAGDGQFIYVELDEEGKIAIRFCSLIMYPSGSCEGNKLLTGQVNE